jgi:hypothetical protein
MIRLNVGGVTFETTEKTLSKCKNIPVVDRNQTIFIDHDPDVFRKTLKILRGYPCDGDNIDRDVLCELTMLGHEFLDVTLPGWMQNAARELISSIHTLDPEQAAAYGATHVLVCIAAVDRLTELGLLSGEKQTCRVVGVKQDWEDCQWVSKAEFELAKKMMMFRKYFVPI